MPWPYNFVCEIDIIWLSSPYLASTKLGYFAGVGFAALIRPLKESLDWGSRGFIQFLTIMRCLKGLLDFDRPA